jgi:hypothetical protein
MNNIIEVNKIHAFHYIDTIIQFTQTQTCDVMIQKRQMFGLQKIINSNQTFGLQTIKNINQTTMVLNILSKQHNLQ